MCLPGISEHAQDLSTGNYQFLSSNTQNVKNLIFLTQYTEHQVETHILRFANCTMKLLIK